MNGTVAAKQPVFCIPQWWLGLLLLLVCWPLNWGLPGVRTAYLFFPLWLGYILAMDALVLSRTGSSAWTRSRREFILLFVLSAPAWWVFELLNQRTGNWEYRGSDRFTDVEYCLLCTVCFSTVMPAVFETAELLRSFPWTERFTRGPRLVPSRRLNLGLFIGGLVMLALTLVWPRYCYPFVWTSLVLLLEPLNGWLGRHHFLEQLQHGDWRQVVSLSLGALVCGFFWEMWNFYSYPKWIYHTPGAQFLACLRDAVAGISGLHPLRVGVVRAEEPALARG